MFTTKYQFPYLHLHTLTTQTGGNYHIIQSVHVHICYIISASPALSWCQCDYSVKKKTKKKHVNIKQNFFLFTVLIVKFLNSFHMKSCVI